MITKLRRGYFKLLLLVFVVVFCKSRPVFAKNIYYGESYALIIGIDQYKNWSRLDYPVHDCVGIHSTLTSFFGFKKKNIVTLYNEDATKEAIINALMFRFSKKRGVNKEDRLIIFFAGHTKSKKLRKKRYRGYLIPYDSYPYAEESSCLSTKLIKSLTDKIPAKHILLVVDACLSVSGFTRSSTLKIEKFADYLKEAASLNGRQVLVAGSKDDIFNTKGPLNFSMFTGNIIKGIQGSADLDRDGFVLISELSDFVKSRIGKEENQTPHLGNIFGSGGGDMVFVIPDQNEAARLKKTTKRFFKKEMNERRKATIQLVRSMVSKYLREKQSKNAEKAKKKQKNKIISRQKRNMSFVKQSIKKSLSKRKKKHKFKLDKKAHIKLRKKLIAKEIVYLKKEAEEIEREISKLTAQLKVLEELSPSGHKHVPIRTRTTRPDNAEMVFIPAGKFKMGTDDGDYEEQPEHTVMLSAFWIDRYEVTNKQYAKFCEETGYRKPAYAKDKDLNQDKQPVTGVSWDDSLAYANWAKKRLPTEAEWEKAARGPHGNQFPWGNKYKKGYANLYGSKDGFKFPAPVGSFPKGASYYGAMDMAGNVWEWVTDYLYDEYYKKSPSKNPPGPKAGTFRVFRGGSWGNYYFVARGASRNGNFPYYRDQYIVGFRLVKDL